MLTPEERARDWSDQKTWQRYGWPPCELFDFSKSELREKAQAIAREYAPIQVARFPAGDEDG